TAMNTLAFHDGEVAVGLAIFCPGLRAQEHSGGSLPQPGDAVKMVGRQYKGFGDMGVLMANDLREKTPRKKSNFEVNG
ncbi:MAG: hypothetical protein JJU11_06220, partial [Candidatus Sumerlaeia bacterium]|nr:hypothetical protein [Candidatus Sumerlaeia bacterium]